MPVYRLFSREWLVLSGGTLFILLQTEKDHIGGKFDFAILKQGELSFWSTHHLGESKVINLFNRGDFVTFLRLATEKELYTGKITTLGIFYSQFLEHVVTRGISIQIERDAGPLSPEISLKL